MPLEQLRIRDFRGVRELDIDCLGKNVAVVGPNGSGKSSVVDALDFLLSGGIKRLTGEGAGGLSLSKHGHNVAADPAGAVVEAVFACADGKRVTLRRRLKEADTLDSDGPVPEDVQRIVDLAKTSGQHLLTRRDILRYIFTEPAKRSDQVGALLHLTGIDALRKEMQGAAKLAGDDAKKASAVKQSRFNSVLRSFEPPASSWDVLRDRVNAQREMLGAVRTDSLSPDAVRKDVLQPMVTASNPLQSQRTKELLASLAQWFEEGAALTTREVIGYHRQVADLHAKAGRLKSARSAQLIANGLQLLESDECPLCLREWDEDDLRKFLNERLAEAGEVQAELRELRSVAGELRARLTGISTIARSIAEHVMEIRQDDGQTLAAFATNLAAATQSHITDPLDPPAAVGGSSEILGQIASSSAETALAHLREAARNLPELSGAQKAWDELRTFEVALREYTIAATESATADRAAKELAIADKIFLESRDAVLQQTYDSIAGRFASLYAMVHKDDESSFKASLSPTKAGLKLEVDFLGVGEFPPCAVHSEGHQDSMGVCLYLTLTEYLAAGPVPLLILDDVMMSVDRDHRRAVANLLKNEFGHCQFIITTHDKVWWRQLRSVGLVNSKGSLEFKSWSLIDGPTMIVDAGRMLREAAEALERKDVPAAAHALRRGVEAYLPDICDALEARVRFHADGAFESGDFLNAAIARYGELLSMARKAAQSWGKKDQKYWDAIDERRKLAISAFQAENWSVNANIHFNEWVDFSPSDFAPVLEAYRNLFSLFVCDSCNSLVEVIGDKNNAVALQCACADTNWNLREKPTA
jgi:predicted ATP-binding protein involved in virulence